MTGSWRWKVAGLVGVSVRPRVERSKFGPSPFVRSGWSCVCGEFEIRNNALQDVDRAHGTSRKDYCVSGRPLSNLGSLRARASISSLASTLRSCRRYRIRYPLFRCASCVRSSEKISVATSRSCLTSSTRSPWLLHRSVRYTKPASTGKDVAVKVQRAGLRELFDVDLKNLRLLAQMLDWLDPKTDGASRNWVEIYNESARLLYEEIDYENEARNAQKFADNFGQHRGNGGAMEDWVRVPRILEAYTSKRVLVMEYVKGTKISKIETIDILGLDRKVLAERLGRFFLEQTLRHGFIHCDPHPGNIAVDDDGRLLVYDFGMCQRLPSRVRRAVVNLVFATYENDAAAFVEALSEMGVLKETADRLTVFRIARYFLKAFRERLDGDAPSLTTIPSSDTGLDRSRPPATSATVRTLPDVKQRLARQASLEKRLAAIGEELLAVADDQPFQFPAVFTFVFRALTSIDGAAKALDPSFDITRLTRPYLRDLVDLRDGSIAKTALKTATKALGWRREDLASVVTQPRKVAYIESVLRKIETGDLKIRVRTLEIERSFKSLSVMVEMLGHGILASVLINMALAGIFATLSYVGAAVCGFRVLVGYINLRLIQQRQAKYARGGN
ncbi:hypothetical protein F1559_001951 [Cyanidiococcus yangmingshanensis]|uniref:ABC1 atypical kinase-like domain-containing protein n=1 Tax=Cyanidiococcus yangmingshanensis TaxID=2690220 RepID=A0A7J7IL10_9RHOD|nr:hypothetical protein F1559_001951 [Cyanidiococcus yangmingshanensis]